MQYVSDAQLRRLTGRLRALMAFHNLTQADIAQRVGIKQPTISRLLTGKRRAWSEDLRRLDDYINSEEISVPGGLQASISAYLAYGGDAVLLEQAIDLMAHAQAIKIRQSSGRSSS